MTTKKTATQRQETLLFLPRFRYPVLSRDRDEAARWGGFLKEVAWRVDVEVAPPPEGEEEDRTLLAAAVECGEVAVRAGPQGKEAGIDEILKTLALCPSRCLFLIACFLCQVAVPFRLLCLPKGEDQLALVIMLFTGPYFLFFCRSAMPLASKKDLFQRVTVGF